MNLLLQMQLRSLSAAEPHCHTENDPPSAHTTAHGDADASYLHLRSVQGWLAVNCLSVLLHAARPTLNRSASLNRLAGLLRGKGGLYLGPGKRHVGQPLQQRRRFRAAHPHLRGTSISASYIQIARERAEMRSRTY